MKNSDERKCPISHAESLKPRTRVCCGDEHLSLVCVDRQAMKLEILQRVVANLDRVQDVVVAKVRVEIKCDEVVEVDADEGLV